MVHNVLFMFSSVKTLYGVAFSECSAASAPCGGVRTRPGSCDRAAMRRLLPILIGAVSCAFVAAGFAGARDHVLYNPSESIPSGFYARIGDAPVAGAVVTVRARDVAPDYARLRDYADDTDRFIKRVAAVAGDVVCAEGDHVTVGIRALTRQARDAEGRALPRWQGCRTLAIGELFLLGDTEDSFDGRYWGPIDARLIEGVWRRL